MSSTEMMAGVGFRNRVSESASGQMACRIGTRKGQRRGKEAGGAVPAATQTPRRPMDGPLEAD